jgi:hypothetical protein
MPPVIPPKEVVAMHEAGHAMMALVTPLRPFIVKAWIFESNRYWEGRMEIDAAAGNKARIPAIYDFARAIAGPLTQILFYPNSIPNSLSTHIQKFGGLLLATKQIKTQNIPVDDVQWWPDLTDWISFVHNHPRLMGTDFLNVEKGVLTFLRDPSVDRSIRSLAHELTDREQLNANELLAHSIAEVPELVLPPSLRYQ